MFKKSALTFILAVLIIIGLTATSFANPGKGNAGWKFNGKGNGKVVQFNDIGSHWAAQTIREMNKLGITSGYPDFSFKPNVPVSRYEAMMMICRADGFDPVEGQSWEDRLEDCLEYADTNGIIDRDEDFEGWKPAKRYEVAVWAMRAWGDLDVDDEELPFLDINDIPEGARHYIGVMFNHKWMVGYPDKKFQPNKPVTRAELTVIIYRMLDNEWPDYDDGDLSALRIKSLDPKDGEDNVDAEKDELVATFNMDIAAVDDLNDVEAGITLRNVTEGEDVVIDSVTINGSELAIDVEGLLDEDMRYRVTIDAGIIESEDGEDEFGGLNGGDWEFFTYDVSNKNLSLESRDPGDGEDNVDPDTTDELVATFNMDIVAVDDLNDVEAGITLRNVTEGEDVVIDSVTINGSELAIDVEGLLDEDIRYRVTIDAGIIESEDGEDEFGGITGSDWEFYTYNRD